MIVSVLRKPGLGSVLRPAFLGLALLLGSQALAQDNATPHLPTLALPEGLHGDFQWDFAAYRKDEKIGAPDFPEKIGSNAYLNLLYDKGPFSAGMRYEIYAPPLQGFDRRYTGSGLPYRFIRYNAGLIDITAGNIYEQLGTGIAFRTYQEWGLGFDNSLDGVRAIVRPGYGVQAKFMVGTQRFYFGHGPGLVRAADLQWRLSDLPGMDSSALAPLTLGVAAVSKYQRDDDPTLRLPENVATVAPRLRYDGRRFTANLEYAWKANDPSNVNNKIYRNGQALWAQIGYGGDQLGFTVAAKRIDNMDFRSDRTASLNDLLINYQPALTPQLTYRLTTLYPYATQTTGEMGIQADFFYRLKPGSPLGGKTGLNFTANYTRINGLDKNPTGDLRGYTSPFFSIGKTLYYEMLQLEGQKKFSPKVKGTFGYYRIVANIPVINVAEYDGIVYSHTGVADVTVKLAKKKSIRTELSHLYTQQDRGSWAMALVEYTVAPHWFFTVWDEYNYKNPEQEKRIHYLGGQMGYIAGGLRLTAGYGRQRAGVFCVGGVCRQIPASNGFTMSISGNF